MGFHTVGNLYIYLLVLLSALRIVWITRTLLNSTFLKRKYDDSGLCSFVSLFNLLASRNCIPTSVSKSKRMNKLFGLDSHESEGRSLHRMHEMNAYT